MDFKKYSLIILVLFLGGCNYGEGGGGGDGGVNESAAEATSLEPRDKDKKEKKDKPMVEVTESKSGKKPNRLINEKSPYLLQHAYNPVDWFPWGEEAFEKARKEGKPVFLSIGYSTCHWCHVMEKEVFDDPEAAALMNEVFVSIKVDREERPDIDNIYMTVSRLLTGGGGWPLNIIMTPDRKPFYAATYIPKESRFGRTGMLELARGVNKAWAEDRESVLETTGRILEALKKASRETPGGELGAETMKRAYDELSARFDPEFGGFGRKPKFPTPHNLNFLLRYWRRSGEERALEMVEKTLEGMRRGGIHDHVGGGFHRYSTDREWLVPHFEKMLYDQALLALAYVEAFQATGAKDYESTAREIFEYVLRDMRGPEGGFYSAEDADSEGEEGKFYLWSVQELGEVLDRGEAELVRSVYGVTKEGNFIDGVTGKRTGDNILHLKAPVKDAARRLGITEDKLAVRLEAARKKLFAFRQGRVHPYKDDKVLTDWNGLMIAALAKGARAFGEPRYTEAARRAASFILKNMRTDDGSLLHRWRGGEGAVGGFLDDYAFFTWGLIELYETGFEVEWLMRALELNGVLMERFGDDSGGGFYLTSDDAEVLLVRDKTVYDGAVPSGNSVAMGNLLRLGRITADPKLEQAAARLVSAFSRDVGRSPSVFTELLTAVDFALGPSYEVVIAGEPGLEDTEAMINALGRSFTPNKVVVFRPAGVEDPEITRIAPYTKEQGSIDGRATAYVCLDYACNRPTTDLGVMLELLERKQGGEESK